MNTQTPRAQYRVEGNVVTEIKPNRAKPDAKPKRAKREVTVVQANDPNFGQALTWKQSICPSCKTQGGWRIGAKFCLQCVEWRQSKRPLKRNRAMSGIH